MRMAVVVTYDVPHPDDTVGVLEALMPNVSTTQGFDGSVRLVVADDVDHLVAWLDDGTPTPAGPTGSERT